MLLKGLNRALNPALNVNINDIQLGGNYSGMTTAIKLAGVSRHHCDPPETPLEHHGAMVLRGLNRALNPVQNFNDVSPQEKFCVYSFRNRIQLSEGLTSLIVGLLIKGLPPAP